MALGCEVFYWSVKFSAHSLRGFNGAVQHRVATQAVTMLRACETIWSEREAAAVALSAEQQRHTENVFYMLLRGTTSVTA